MAEPDGGAPPLHEHEPVRRKWHATVRTRFATLGLFVSRRTAVSTLDPVARFTRLLAVMTGLVALTAALQVVTFVMSERAFLTLSEVSPHQAPLAAGKPLNLLLEIRNGGKSTARVDQLNVNYRMQDLPETPEYPSTSTQLFSAPILPGTSTTFGVGDESKVVSPEQFNGIIAGTTKFYLFGFIRYADEFSLFGYRVTGFCLLYAPAGDPNSIKFTTCNKRRYVYASGTWAWPWQ